MLRAGCAEVPGYRQRECRRQAPDFQQAIFSRVYISLIIRVPALRGRVRACSREGTTMKRLGILGLSAMLAAGLASSPSSAVAQQKSLKEQLTGTWTLVSRAANSNTRPNTKGILILEASGYYAELFGPPDQSRPFAANYGTWLVSEADRTLTQRFEGAANPINDGAEVKSSVELEGDELKLARVLPSSGARQEFVYRRAR
jgi:hypothetical protein